MGDFPGLPSAQEQDDGTQIDVPPHGCNGSGSASEIGDSDMDSRRKESQGVGLGPVGAGRQRDAAPFSGQVFHSSQLDAAYLRGRTVLVIGSGASGVEAVETALRRGAKATKMIARDDEVSRAIPFSLQGCTLLRLTFASG